jgi:hypothetical protein
MRVRRARRAAVLSRPTGSSNEHASVKRSVSLAVNTGTNAGAVEALAIDVAQSTRRVHVSSTVTAGACSGPAGQAIWMSADATLFLGLRSRIRLSALTWCTTE